MRVLLALWTLLAVGVAAEGDEFRAYSPKPTGATLFLETFQDAGSESGQFVKSMLDKYKDQPVKVVEDTGIEGDFVISLEQPAKHYGITAPFAKAVRAGDGLLVQYEARFNQGLDCGGAYVKLFAKETLPNLKNVNNDTPYIIMFGPDKCGNTKKIHLILRHKNPVSGEWEEKHLKKPPTWDHHLSTTQLFTLWIDGESDEYWIKVNGKQVSKGSLMEDFDPPVAPLKQIDDPEDKKPEDWVDEAKIADPEAKKPEDWDEEAPRMIADPEAKMPEAWLPDAPKKIADPAAEMPSDWDEEEDGEWEAPEIDNPACKKAGCGPWKPRQIANPAFKGKWSAPMIDNPAYKGVWKPKKIDNPNFFTLDNVADSLEAISAIAIEVWTMNGKIGFDNFLVADNAEVAQEFADITFTVKREAQEAAKEKARAAARAKRYEAMLDGSVGGYMQFALAKFSDALSENPLMVGLGSVLAVLVLIFGICSGICSQSKPKRPAPAPKKAAKATKAEEPSGDADAAAAADDADDEDADADADAAEAKEEKDAPEDVPEQPVPEKRRSPRLRNRKKKKKTPRAE